MVVVRLRRLAPATPARGVPGEERDVGRFVVPGHAHLAPPVVLAEQEAVVGDDEKHRVAPHVVGVHEVDHRAKVVVALRQ